MPRPSGWKQMYGAFMRRTRTYTLVSGAFQEVMNVAVITVKVKVGTNGLYTLDLRPMKLASILNVSFQPINPTNTPLNARVQVELIGEPTKDSVTVRATKPLLNALNLVVGDQVAAGAELYLVVRGPVAV